MTAEYEFTIQDLSEQAKVTRRTIYFYTQQGILPPPSGAGLAARYQKEHLLKLLLIPHLRRKGLRLDEIREQFRKLEVGELEQMIQTKEAESEISTAEYQQQSFAHYQFPGGITIIAPSGLTQGQRKKLQALIEAANQILGDTD